MFGGALRAVAVLAAAMTAVSACQILGGFSEISLEQAAPDPPDPNDAGGPEGDGATGEETSSPDVDSGEDPIPCVVGNACVGHGTAVPEIGGTCKSGVMVPCDRPGAACCPGGSAGADDFCFGRNVCTGGTCEACGGRNQPCCTPPSNVTCTSGGCCDPTTSRCVDEDGLCSTGRCDDGVCHDSACGDLGDACCAGDVCNERFSYCQGASTCVSCGSPGEPCCDPAGARLCKSGSTCRGESCVECGGVGAPCCDGDVCSAGTCDKTEGTCSVKTGCGTCGGPGEPCCDGVCALGACCDQGVCVAGGQPCQDGICTAGLCVCGYVGGPCCASGTCLAGACCAEGQCVAPNAVCPGTLSRVCKNGACAPCGSTGQPCCGTSCSGTRCCNQTTPGGSCVAQGQACSSNRVCRPPGRDVGADGCADCGNSGQPCCAGSSCFTGACYSETCP